MKVVVDDEEGGREKEKGAVRGVGRGVSSSCRRRRSRRIREEKE